MAHIQNVAWICKQVAFFELDATITTVMSEYDTYSWESFEIFAQIVSRFLFFSPFLFFLHFSVKKRSCLHSFLQTFKGTLALAKATTIILSKKMHVFQCLWLKKMLYYQLWFSPIGADAIKLWKFRIQHINFWHLLIFHNLCPKCHVFYGSIIQEITHKIEIMNIPKGNLLIHRNIIWLLHAKPNGNNIYDNTQKIRIQCAGIMLISYMLRMLQQCWALSHPPQSANFSAKTWAAR